jgi:hypothetical protein
VVEFQYFMVRVRRTTDAGADGGVPPEGHPLTGVVERLNSGEKRNFASANELLQLVAAWTGSSANVQPAQQPRNTAP